MIDVDWGIKAEHEEGGTYALRVREAFCMDSGEGCEERAGEERRCAR